MSSEPPGYDAMAQTYADLTPDAFQAPTERAAVDAFAQHVLESQLGRTIVDVGCGTGQVAAYLTDAGFGVTAVDPSVGMLDQARLAHSDITFVQDDATLHSVDLDAAAGVLARFSLIHVTPDRMRNCLHDWATRLRPGAMLLLAGQSTDDPGVEEFDHAVARAWRWHPDTLVAALTAAGFDEVWRTVARPADGFHRFPEFHVCATRR